MLHIGTSLDPHIYARTTTPSTMRCPIDRVGKYHNLPGGDRLHTHCGTSHDSDYDLPRSEQVHGSRKKGDLDIFLPLRSAHNYELGP